MDIRRAGDEVSGNRPFQGASQGAVSPGASGGKDREWAGSGQDCRRGHRRQLAKHASLHVPAAPEKILTTGEYLPDNPQLPIAKSKTLT